MDKEFVPYEEALALKELGFDEPCFAYFDEDGDFLNFYEGRNSYAYPPTNKDIDLTYFTTACTSPLYQQAFRWFREKKLFQCEPQYNHHFKDYQGVLYDLRINKCITDTIGYKDRSGCKTYEEAELACLRKLIEITKNKRDE
jgi:hypothetical protein